MHALKTGSEKSVTKEATSTNYTSRPSTAKVTSTGASKQNNKGSVKIIAKADIGFGNRLYIRGDGCGLSWNKGMEMKSIDDSHWQWECKDVATRRHFEFKVLINDEIWSTGENYVAIDENNEILPVF
ncbi:MAG: hypothetical protein LBQ23_00190 [Puniceicoccales bacterium]|jgi:3D (Asp-Asp-Asp) domain-containing protein|nr:hypothetical protein [Puniceicoccales bacterium]